jgi:HD-GYP domain-containing protein (c-di-GMP phosphodiesterase class II)
LGKRNIPSAILNKPGALTPQERQAIEQHPQLGFEAICFHPGVSWGSLMMVYQHHERLDGSGYPVGLVTDEMHPWSKICAVSDVFDAFMTKRNYHAPRTLDEGLSLLASGAGTRFDKEIVECLHALVLNN